MKVLHLKREALYRLPLQYPNDILYVACSGSLQIPSFNSKSRPSIEGFYINKNNGSLVHIPNSFRTIGKGLSALMTNLNFTLDGTLWLSYYSRVQYFGSSLFSRFLHLIFAYTIGFIYPYLFPTLLSFSLQSNKTIKIINGKRKTFIGEAYGSSPSLIDNKLYLTRTITSTVDIYEIINNERKLLGIVKSEGIGCCWSYITKKGFLYVTNLIPQSRGITVFKIKLNGMLEKIQTLSTPTHSISIFSDVSEKFIFVYCRHISKSKSPIIQNKR